MNRIDFKVEGEIVLLSTKICFKVLSIHKPQVVYKYLVIYLNNK